MSPTKQVIFDGSSRPDYTKLDEITRHSPGWMRSSGGEHGESIEVWHEDTEYVFRGRAVVDFLYAVKDSQNRTIYAAKDLVEYIEKAAKQQPSVFVRDAIVYRAAELKALIEGKAEVAA